MPLALNVHSEYSVLDGIIKIKEYAQRVKELSMTAAAVTDHASLSGLIEWYKAGQKVGINTILGVEAYLTNDEDGIIENKNKTRDNYHCVLLAKNNTGLKNIIYLTNLANFHNFYYKPRINIKNLEKYSEGIICTSACLGSFISKTGEYRDNKFYDVDNKARDLIKKFSKIFDGDFYTEIQDNPEFWQQDAYNKWLIKTSRENNIPLVITTDAHWLKKEDKQTHNMIMAQQLNKSISDYLKAGDEDGLYYGNGHYIKTPQEMYESAVKYNAEDAFYNTIKIASTCKINLQLGEYELPEYDITKEKDYNEFIRTRTKL